MLGPLCPEEHGGDAWRLSPTWSERLDLQRQRQQWMKQALQTWATHGVFSRLR